MTTSPISIRAGPFLQNIMRYTNQYSVEESMILFRFDDIQKSPGFFIFDIFDKITFSVFFTLFLAMVLIILLINDKYFVSNENIFLRSTKVFLFLYGTLI